MEEFAVIKVIYLNGLLNSKYVMFEIPVWVNK